MTALANALPLARAGFRVVWVHAPVGDGCSCGRKDCSRSKHPILDDWPSVASNDEATLSTQLGTLGVSDPNVGIALGRQVDGRYLVAVDVDDAGRFAELEVELAGR